MKKKLIQLVKNCDETLIRKVTDKDCFQTFKARQYSTNLASYDEVAWFNKLWKRDKKKAHFIRAMFLEFLIESYPNH